LSISNQRFGR
ncbi:hypothetical protein D030_5344B, partial [Vibrio parahaemolyticus AQ3810]